MKHYFLYLLLAAITLASCGNKKSDNQGADISETRSETSNDATTSAEDFKPEEGVKAQDFTLMDINGKEHKLSDFIGATKQGRKHYILVDFWASWCQPCMMEMPNVKANWELYRDQGFEVVGISLDKDKDAWQKAVKDNGYDWTQLSDLQSFDSPVAALYKLEFIPWNFICDENGTIIATNLRGNELSAKLKELYM